MEIFNGFFTFFCLLLGLLAGGFFILGLAMAENSLKIILPNILDGNNRPLPLGELLFALISLYLSYGIFLFLILAALSENSFWLIENPPWQFAHLPLWAIILTFSILTMIERQKNQAKA